MIVALPCAAGEFSLSASTTYRLNVSEPNSLRLAGLTPAEPAIPPQLADKPYAALISSAARKAALDPALVHAVIFVESRYQAAARSPKGAIGLMQVLPETAARYGVADPAKSPEANVKAGTLYLQDLMQLFDGRLELALAAYNAGENAVLRYGHRVPPYPETQSYVPAVLARYREWREPVVTPGPARIEYLPGTRLDLTASGTVLQ
jgi:lysozyme